MARARHALILRGYPNPTLEEIKSVLQYVYQEDTTTPAAGERHPSEPTCEDPSALLSGVRVVPPHAAPAPKPQETTASSAQRQEKATTRGRQYGVRRPQWDDSTAKVAPPSSSRFLMLREAERKEMPLYHHRKESASAAGEPPRWGIPNADKKKKKSFSAADTPVSAAVQLERYIRVYERELMALYARHPTLAPAGSQYSAGEGPTLDQPSESQADGTEDGGEEEEEGPIRSAPKRRHTAAWPGILEGEGLGMEEPMAASSSITVEGSPKAVLQMPLRVNHQRKDAAAAQRRAANVVFSITGDPRYRFRPPTPAPAVPVDPSPPRTVKQQEQEALGPEIPHSRPQSILSSEIPPPRRLQPPFNDRLYRRGSGSKAMPRATPLASYVDPTGSTLNKKSDPVRRGQQMRSLWDKDHFLKKTLVSTGDRKL